MENLPNTSDTGLLIHIEHSQPIDVGDLVSSLNAVNNLYMSFVRKTRSGSARTKSRLYVEKVHQGSIDIYLLDVMAAAIIPFAENVNVLFEFAGYIKRVYDYFCKGRGDKPQLDSNECGAFSEMLNVVTADQNGTMTIGAVNRADNGAIYNNCTFVFGESSGAQRLLLRECDSLKQESDAEVHERVLMKIFQVRNESDTDKGNKAIIDTIFPGRKMGVVFQSDALKNAILFDDFNPIQKAFWVDVTILTVEGKPKAYNVTRLHDIIDLEE